MNRILGKAGAGLTMAAVLLFALCMLVQFSFGSYFVCMLLPIGYILMTAGFYQECGEDRRAAAVAGMVFAAIYATLVFLVYFAQTTTVRLEALDAQALAILDYQRGGLFFSYDLLGYGMMALSTLLMGLTVRAETRADRWLKGLMTVHGVFFVSCFLLPMTGVFRGMAEGGATLWGTVALEFWCAYFFPIALLAYRHFDRKGR